MLATMAKDDDAPPPMDWSPEGLAREARKWRLVNEAHLDLYVLWTQMAGLGGNPLGDLFDLADRPGSAALFRDFRVLSARKKRLGQQEAFFKEVRKQ